MKRFFLCSAVGYTIFLLYMMLFGCGRFAGEISDFQLTPFRSISNYFSADKSFSFFLLNFIGNIFVFMPFGFLGSLFSPLRKFFPLFFTFSAGIISVELVQHYTGRGTADIDDLILNVSGMSISYFLRNIIRIIILNYSPLARIFN